MKNTLIALWVLLFAAVAYLYVDRFSNTPNDIAKASDKGNRVTDTGRFASHIRMAWLNTDSLVANYDYHRQLRTQLESKFKRMEADIARRTDLLKENYEVLQKQAPRLNQEKLQRAQQELMLKEQELRAYSNERAEELSQEEQELNLMIKEDMDVILDSVKEEYKLDFIFSYDPNSILLNANPQYEITDIVVKRLNEKYKASQQENAKP